ncbi:MAG: ECF transporter S component [Eubacteriales bacterium]|nr:ECF transporter S component [Eubacteriales bacterium]
MKQYFNLKNLVLSALFIALGLVLPFFTGQIREIGKMLLPMHLPIFLCSAFCGSIYGLIIGIIVPIFRSLLFGMPIMIKAFGMAFELAGYGFFFGLLLKMNSTIKINNLLWTYFSLILSMILGRIIYAFSQIFILGIQGSKYTFELFFSGTILSGIPGIILQLIIIPPIILLLKKYTYTHNNK